MNKEFDDGSSRSVYEYRSEDELKAIIDDAAKYNGWVIFMTHLRNRDTFYYNDEIKNRMINVCEYAALKGCRFMTFGDAYDLRKNQFENERFVVDYNGTIHIKN